MPDATPHYAGHRDRLRARFLKGGTDSLAEYELLELVLFMVIPRRDVKPLAKSLIGARVGQKVPLTDAIAGETVEVLSIGV